MPRYQPRSVQPGFCLGARRPPRTSGGRRSPRSSPAGDVEGVRLRMLESDTAARACVPFLFFYIGGALGGFTRLPDYAPGLSR